MCVFALTHGRVHQEKKSVMTSREPSWNSLFQNELDNSLFRTLFDAMPQLGWTASADGFIDFYNKGWYEYTGTTLEQMRGWGWESVHDPEMLPEVKHRWKQSIDQGIAFEMKFPLRSARGEFRWFLTRVNPVKDGTGKVVRWVGINTDIQSEIDASARAENLVEERTAQLVEVKRRLEAVAELLSNFVRSGDFRQASMTLLKLILEETQSEYGFIGPTVAGGPQGTVLRVFADAGFHWSRTENRDLYEKILQDYDTKGYIEFPRLDNLFGWPILHGKPIIVNDPATDERRSGRRPAGHPPLNNFLGLPLFRGGDVIGTIGIANRAGGYTEAEIQCLDLLCWAASVIFESYHRVLNEQSLLKELDLALQSVNASKEALLDLSYAVSHELQEPVRIINSELSLLAVRYSGRLGADADSFIDDSLRAARIVGQMLDDLWEYARIERSAAPFALTNLSTVLQNVLVDLDSEIKSQSATITFTSLPEVPCEPRQIATVFRHLIQNALTFNVSTQPTISISSQLLVDEWEISVSDNGIGFEPTEVGEVFKMFRKLSRDTKGSGMGLSICKRIIESHGGHIFAQSEKGSGATFRFTLPIIARR